MKKLLLAGMLASSFAFANENFIEVGGGSINFNDNFNTKSDDTSAGFLNFYLGTSLSPTTDIYAKTLNEDINVGAKLHTSLGVFDLGFKTDFMGKAWDNPYSRNKSETDIEEHGLYIGYNFSFGSDHGATIRYEISDIELDDEKSISSLNRDGKRQIIKFENNFYLDMFGQENALHTNYRYENYEADGKASAYKRHEIQAGFSTQILFDINMTVLGNIGKIDYEAYNVLVGNKVNAEIYGAKLVLTKENIFGLNNTFASFKTGYGIEEANDKFYDKEGTFGIFSIGYRF